MADTPRDRADAAVGPTSPPHRAAFSRRRVLIAALILAAALLPQLTQRRDILNLLFLIFLYTSLGQSWNILAGFAGQTSLGHAAFFGIGALVARALWTGGFPFPLAFLAAGVAAMLAGLILGIPAFRLRGAYFAIGTLAVAEALRLTVGNALPLITTLPLEAIVTYDLAARYYLALGVALATVLAAELLLRSRWSLGILAVREDEDAAQATGVNALRHKALALAISTFFAGLAGATFAYYQVSYYPEAPFSPHWTFDALLITFVGGLGTIAGPVVGAVFYVVVREQLAVSLVNIHQILFGFLFIIVVLALPGGLVDLFARLHRK